MLFKKLFFLAILFLFLMAACVPFGNIDLGVETSTPAAPTQPAEPGETPLPDTTPVASTGTVSGRVCYPSEFIPAMTAYFQQTPNGNLTELSIVEGQNTYTTELAPGTYRAFAWVEAFQLGGAFSAYVACGYAETCTDHSLISFEVVAGQEITGVDLCDWPFPAEQLPIPRPVSTGDPSLHGLTYSIPEGPLYRLDSNGNPTSLNSALGVVISPDGTSGLYPLNGDLYIMPLAGGESVNLTNTPDFLELLYQWPLQDRIFFAGIPSQLEGGPGTTGGLYSIRPDGTDYRVLDGQTNAGNFAVSLDGRFVAYGSGTTGYIYDLQLNQRSVFDPTTFGINSANGLYLTSPSWSPDSTKLAWITQGDFMGEGAFAVVVFDLTTNTTEIIHPYHIIGMDGFLAPAKFSADGNWIAFTAYDQDPNRYGVWVASVGDPNQSTEFFLGAYSNSPFWSPDSTRLAFSQFVESEQVNRVFVYILEANAITQAVTLPVNVTLIDW